MASFAERTAAAKVRLAVLSLLAALVGPATASAEPRTAASTPVPAAPGSGTQLKGLEPTAHARIALSRSADGRLAELRLRRLLAIEFGRRVQLDRESNGPLQDDLVQIWVDLVEEKVVLHVRRMGRSLALRTLDIAGYPPDLAARLVAIEASEMVRVQVNALRPEPCTGCRPQSKKAPSELAALTALGSAFLRVTPTADAPLLAGPRLEVGHQHAAFRQSVYGEWLIADDGATATRWLALGIGIDGRLPVGSLPTPWRFAFGARAGLVSLHRRGSADLDDWSASTAARIAAERALPSGVWVGLALEPGLIVRPIHDHLAGFTLGASLTLAAAPRH